MDCFFTAVRMSLSHRRSKDGASDAEDAAIRGPLRKVISGTTSNSSSDSTEEALCAGQAGSRLKRQRAAAFFMSYYICGRRSSVSGDEHTDGNAQFIIEVEVQRSPAEVASREMKGPEKVVLPWQQERGKKRRKLQKEEWVAAGDVSDGNLLRRAPARLRRLMRRVRAKMRKIGRVQKAASFRYDPLSYSMNFDEGCWQHCEAHARFSYSSSPSANSSCSSNSSTGKLPIYAK